MKRILAIALLGFVVSTCGPRGRDGDGTDQTVSVPVIDSVVPASGRVGVAYPVLVTLHGHGFADSTNVVTFGEVRLDDRPSGDGGTTLSFSVPKQQNLGLEAPPRVLRAGSYDITVTTPSGVSNAVTFTLTQNP